MYDISQLNQMMRHSRILTDITGREMSDFKDAYGPQIADSTEENEELGEIQSNIVQETNTLPHTIDESDVMPKDKEYESIVESQSKIVPAMGQEDTRKLQDTLIIKENELTEERIQVKNLQERLTTYEEQLRRAIERNEVRHNKIIVLREMLTTHFNLDLQPIIVAPIQDERLRQERDPIKTAKLVFY
jgi:hypothetical protein